MADQLVQAIRELLREGQRVSFQPLGGGSEGIRITVFDQGTSAEEASREVDVLLNEQLDGTDLTADRIMADLVEHLTGRVRRKHE